jgi:hypothetical protein
MSVRMAIEIACLANIYFISATIVLQGTKLQKLSYPKLGLKRLTYRPHVDAAQ